MYDLTVNLIAIVFTPVALLVLAVVATYVKVSEIHTMLKGKETA